RKVRVARAGGRGVGREAFGIEACRVRPEIWMAVRGVRADRDTRPGADPVPADLVVSDGLARDGPDRRIQAERLVEDHARVRQARQIIDTRGPSAHRAT